jgi:hypothetical protein
VGKFYVLPIGAKRYQDGGVPDNVKKGTLVFDMNRNEIDRAIKDFSIADDSEEEDWFTCWETYYDHAILMANTEIIRKLYPNAEEFGEYLVIGEKNVD